MNKKSIFDRNCSATASPLLIFRGPTGGFKGFALENPIKNPDKNMC